MIGSLPVLWLCGPPGAGKTAVGWDLFTQLSAMGIVAGYVDTDQLGMCYPEPADDPGRHRMQLRNVAAVLRSFRAEGASCVVVSGVVDPARGVDPAALPGVALTVCRLRGERAELTRRFTGRGGPAELVGDVLRVADALDANGIGDVTVDTSDRTIAEVARLVRERTGWPDLAQRPSVAPAPGPAGAGGDILWLCGPTGVGKSTIGFEVYRRLLGSGPPTAFVDLGQLGFLRPAPADDPANHRVKARSLAGLWQTFHDAGARTMVVVGPVEDDAEVTTYTAALPQARITLYRLHAAPEELADRILIRGRGGSWPEPGDPLAGKPAPYLRSVADQAAADSERLERAALAAVRIDTTGLTAAQAADLVAATVRRT
jgi:adenylylsulfate kinase-like enzyme